MKYSSLLSMVALVFLTRGASGATQAPPGKVVIEHLQSTVLRENKVGLNPDRSISIYLPPGYGAGPRAFPAIYYFHSFSTNNERMFADGSVARMFDRAIAEGVIKPFILVAADYSTPKAVCFFENSSTAGRWLDFTVDELLPFVDQHYRTLRDRNSRGVAGDMIGGYGALKFAMLYPDRFSVVYALHPVGTGTGVAPMAQKPDWAKIHRAQSFADLQGEGFSQIFLSMSQAFLPNPGRPPFYCDFMVEMENGVLKQNPEHSRTLETHFLLDQLLAANPALAANLRTMRGIKFDWGRYDSNTDHVFANQAFTRKLDELGIDHEAEEYRGNNWDQNWTPHGRVHDELLPFFARYLVFDPGA